MLQDFTIVDNELRNYLREELRSTYIELLVLKICNIPKSHSLNPSLTLQASETSDLY